MLTSQYLIALGSNQRHVRYGLPRAVLAAGISAISERDIIIISTAKTIGSNPVGPSSRHYANSAAIIETGLTPPQLLGQLKEIEQDFGQRKGQKWSRRVLDIDIILWNRGIYSSSDADLIIPHPMMRERSFVLRPAAEIAGKWRDPLTGCHVHQLNARLNAARPKQD